MLACLIRIRYHSRAWLLMAMLWLTRGCPLLLPMLSLRCWAIRVLNYSILA